MTLLSHGLRGAIVAAPGHQLFVADYAAIEARVVMWLAGEDAIGIFQPGTDIYCELASSIYGYPVIPNKENQPPERFCGKQATLGCGFQMGWSKFQATCAKYGIEISDELAQKAVNAYRERFWRVKQMWYDQEQAAIDALHIDTEDTPVPCGYVSWVLEGQFLFCTLPSGRRIAYPKPQLTKRKTPWGETKWVLAFMGMNPITRKWERQTTYGGSIVENVTQGVARDVMAEAMLRCEASGYPIVLSVHDEVIAESANGDIKEFERLVARVPVWASGMPIAVEGFVAQRYKK